MTTKMVKVDIKKGKRGGSKAKGKVKAAACDGAMPKHRVKTSAHKKDHLTIKVNHKGARHKGTGKKA